MTNIKCESYAFVDIFMTGGFYDLVFTDSFSFASNRPLLLFKLVNV